MAHQPAHDKLTTQAVANLCQAQMVVQAKVHEAEMQQAHSTRVSLEARHQVHLEATQAKSQAQLVSLHAVYQASLAVSEANGQAKLHCMQALHQQEVAKLQHQAKSKPSQACFGLSSQSVKAILGAGIGSYFGNMSTKYLFTALRVQCQESNTELPFQSEQEFEFSQPGRHQQLKELLTGVPLYRANEHSIQSTLCLRCSVTSTCPMCASLAKERSVQKRVHNAESVESLNPSNYARRDRVKTAVLISRLKGTAAKIKLLFYSDRNTKAALAVAEKRVVKHMTLPHSGVK